MAEHKRFSWTKLLLWALIIVATCWALFPFYWAIITSFKEPGVIVSRPAWIPFLQFTPTLQNWQSELLTRGDVIGRAMGNSFIIATGATAIATILGTLAGYGLARFRFYGWKNKDITMFFLSQRFLPPTVTVIPFFLLFQRLNLLDSTFGLTLVNATFTMPFAVLMLRDTFKEMPVELEESAWVDGASVFQSFRLICLPLAAPGIAAAAVICFAFSWNEFLFGLILSLKHAQPMTVIIAGVEHVQGVQFWQVATRLLLAILPPALLAVTVQRYIVRGLTFGAIKG